MGWKETLEGLYKSRNWAQATAQERNAAVTDVIQVSSLGAAAVSVTPVPLADVVLAMPMQAAMVVAIGHIKGRDISKEESFKIARELSTVVGTHMLAKRAFIALSRIIFPGAAGFVLAPWTFGITWAMGRVAELYFDDPNAPERVFKEKFSQGLEDARKVFSKDAFMDFMKRRGQDAQDFAQANKVDDPAQPSSSGSKGADAEWDATEEPSRGSSSASGEASTGSASKPASKTPAPAAGVVEADWDDVPPAGGKQ